MLWWWSVIFEYEVVEQVQLYSNTQYAYNAVMTTQCIPKYYCTTGSRTVLWSSGVLSYCSLICMHDKKHVSPPQYMSKSMYYTMSNKYQPYAVAYATQPMTRNDGHSATIEILNF